MLVDDRTPNCKRVSEMRQAFSETEAEDAIEFQKEIAFKK
jgi:hypothetical protein